MQCLLHSPGSIIFFFIKIHGRGSVFFARGCWETDVLEIFHQKIHHEYRPMDDCSTVYQSIKCLFFIFLFLSLVTLMIKVD